MIANYTDRYIGFGLIERTYADSKKWIGKHRLKDCERCQGKGTLKVWKRWWRIRVPGRVQCPGCGGSGSTSYFSGIPVPKAPWEREFN